MEFKLVPFTITYCLESKELVRNFLVLSTGECNLQ
jgi:hypothetical protein